MDLGRIAERHPEKPALIMASGRRTITYRELDRRSNQAARLLADHGIGRGDHIAILMENCPEFLEIAWAAQRSGIYYTPVNWHLTEDEAAYVINDCGARALFASEGVGNLALRVHARATSIEFASMVGAGAAGFLDYETELAKRTGHALAEQAEGIYFFYSSGTTGMPKGIEPVHAFPPFGTGLPIDHVMSSSFGFDAQAVYLCPTPLYHAAPLGWSLGTQRQGGTVVLMDRFDPLACLRAIEGHAVTHAQFVPTHFVRMLKLPAGERDSADLSSLKVVVHAAAPCPVDVKQQMIDWLGPKVLEFYAGSEGTGMTFINSQDWLTHRGSVGKAAIGVLHIVGEDGDELPAGQVGSVYFEGGGAFRYHNDDDRTAQAFNDQGWSTLGDLGHVDEEGFLYLADRRTDLIISGGVNIYPAEIEDALVMHPSVADVAVIGIPDDEMGQSVRAVVEPAAGVVGDTALAQELMTFSRQRLAGFKCPRSVVFTPELPRLPTGKLLRRRVREQFGNG